MAEDAVRFGAEDDLGISLSVMPSRGIASTTSRHRALNHAAAHTLHRVLKLPRGSLSGKVRESEPAANSDRAIGIAHATAVADGGAGGGECWNSSHNSRSLEEGTQKKH
jgi:hypothetical protein